MEVRYKPLLSPACGVAEAFVVGERRVPSVRIMIDEDLRAIVRRL